MCTVGWTLQAVHCIQFTLGCTLQHVQYSVYTVFFIQQTVICRLYTECCKLQAIACTLQSVHQSVYTVFFIQYAMICRLYTVCCTLQDVACTLQDVNFMLYTVFFFLYTQVILSTKSFFTKLELNFTPNTLPNPFLFPPCSPLVRWILSEINIDRLIVGCTLQAVQCILQVELCRMQVVNCISSSSLYPFH